MMSPLGRDPSIAELPAGAARLAQFDEYSASNAQVSWKSPNLGSGHAPHRDQCLVSANVGTERMEIQLKFSCIVS